MSETSLQALLTSSWPFAYLPTKTRQKLAAEISFQSFKAGECIYDFAQALDQAYLLLHGSVESYIKKDGQLRFCEEISEGALLGERFVLLDLYTTEKLIAASSLRCAVLPKTVLRRLTKNHPRFSHAIARSLRQKQAIFAPLNHFCTRLEESAERGNINFEELLELYKQISPALHPKLHTKELDEAGWSYAINRLPNDLIHTHVYLLTPMPPVLLTGTQALSQPVESKARRRTAWKLTPGKTLVILRDAKTDLSDFVTNLCLHAVEAQKMRRKLHSAELVDSLYRAAHQAKETQIAIEQDLYQIYGEEWDAFCRLFPNNPIQRLWELVAHHEDYSLYIEKDLNLYDNDSAELWTEQLRSAAEKLVGDIEDIPVDIISSNTFGVRHCLSPLIHQQKQQILAWGQQNHPQIYNADFPNPIDRLYALLKPYMKAHPGFETQMRDNELKNGIILLKTEGFTGIDIELIALHKLPPKYIDESLRQAQPIKKQLLVNIDYAFGHQAEDILGCLILLFGKNIQSINVMGKAGALTGKRGDILKAHTVLMERSDDVYAINNQDLDPHLLATDSGRTVHEGAVLTVQGTLLQNKTLLTYYKHFWHCIGLEMEGSFYARQVHRAQNLGLIPADIALRFLYFVSDLPLNEGENLSKDMSPHEFISPLYSITRAFLNAVLK